MSQLSKHLRAEEKVLWSGRPVKVPFILNASILVPVITGISLTAMGIIALYAWTVPGETLTTAACVTILFLILFGLSTAFIPIMFQLMRYRTTEYMITDQRMITQTGAIGIDTRFVDLDKIQEVYVRIGIIDRFFGTGSIRASTAGGWPVARAGALPILDALKDPYNVQKILQEAIQKAKTSSQT